MVTKVTNAFDPNNTTAGGHTKFSKFNKNGVDMAWKDTKELQVEIGGAKIPVSLLDEEVLTNLVTNLKVVRAIAKEFPQPLMKTKKKTKSMNF
jgi:hypothetical protein